VNTLLKLILITLIAGSAVGCGREARITGPTQCLAPRAASRVVQASAIVQRRADLVTQTPAAPETF
jgi:hypothetical protein